MERVEVLESEARQDEFVNIEELSQFLGVPKSWIYERTRRGEISIQGSLFRKEPPGSFLMLSSVRKTQGKYFPLRNISPLGRGFSYSYETTAPM